MKKSVLLIISGGVAAYKALTVIRDLTKIGIKSKVILTKGGSEFVTPLSVGALSGNKVYTDLWNLTDETEMGHIELSRSADLIAVVPATANLIAKAANGIADDLASTTILATDKPVLYAPSMNVRMWEAEATKRNIKTLENVLQKTKQIQGVRFEWDSEHDKIKNDKQIAFPTAFSGESIGFIAQDLEKVIPELVFTDDDGYKSVEYGQLVSLGIGSIQEQQRTIDSIYERINKLKEIIGG